MAQTLIFEAGSTNHFETFTVNGTAGNLIAIDSSDFATPHFLVNDTITGIVCEYLDLSHSHASSINYWNANDSLNTIDNTGWFEGTDTPSGFTLNPDQTLANPDLRVSRGFSISLQRRKIGL